MQLTHIPVDRLLDAWPLIQDKIQYGINRNHGRYTEESLFEVIASGDWKLWVVWDGQEIKAAVMTEVYEELSGLRIGTVRFLVGRDRKEWVHLIEELKIHFADEGATRLEIWAAKGWQRDLPEMKMTHVLLEQDIEPNNQLQVA